MHLQAVIGFLKQIDELKVAEQLLDVFSRYATNLQQYDELAMLYNETKHYKKALHMLGNCLSVAPSHSLFEIRSNYAKVYNCLNDPQKSIEYSQLNLEENPDSHETMMELSFSYYLLGNKEKSYQIQSQLLDNDNVDRDIKERIMYNMGTFYMERGKFKEGIRNMIRGGRGLGIWPYIEKPYPKWDGENTDKTLLIYAEAGMGDELINVRFINELKRRNIKSIWISLRQDMVDVYNFSGYKAIHHKTTIDPLDEYVYIEAMSLPIYLDLDKEQLWTGPYIVPKPEYIDKWKKILPEKFMTLKWRGNPYYEQDLHRFLDIDMLLDKFAGYNIPLVSIQIDEKKNDPRIINLDIKNWDDTLAIQHLALCNITSCTSTAHSAAAMDVNTIILPPIATYYPWINMRDEIHSFWYGDKTVLFPQKEHKNWITPLDKAAKYIENYIL